jgi:hypothetical protein
MKRAQDVVPRVPPRALNAVIQAFGRTPLPHWAFGHYGRIADPSFAAGPAPAPRRARAPGAA